MKRNRFTDEQIIGMLKEHVGGTTVSELCRKHGVSVARIDKWKAKFGGMDVSEAKRLKTLEDENTKLKRLRSDEEDSNWRTAFGGQTSPLWFDCVQENQVASTFVPTAMAAHQNPEPEAASPLPAPFGSFL